MQIADSNPREAPRYIVQPVMPLARKAPSMTCIRCRDTSAHITISIDYSFNSVPSVKTIKLRSRPPCSSFSSSPSPCLTTPMLPTTSTEIFRASPMDHANQSHLSKESSQTDFTRNPSLQPTRPPNKPFLTFREGAFIAFCAHTVSFTAAWKLDDGRTTTFLQGWSYRMIAGVVGGFLALALVLAGRELGGRRMNDGDEAGGGSKS